MESENPMCIRIRVILLFSTPKIPPYKDTRGIISTWNGITIEAIIKENKSPHAFHLLRTITNAVIAESRIVKIVEIVVIIKEFVKDVAKFIFFMASVKLVRINP